MHEEGWWVSEVELVDFNLPPCYQVPLVTLWYLSAMVKLYSEKSWASLTYITSTVWSAEIGVTMWEKNIIVAKINNQTALDDWRDRIYNTRLQGCMRETSQRSLGNLWWLGNMCISQPTAEWLLKAAGYLLKTFAKKALIAAIFVSLHDFVVKREKVQHKPETREHLLQSAHFKSLNFYFEAQWSLFLVCVTFFTVV